MLMQSVGTVADAAVLKSKTAYLGYLSAQLAGSYWGHEVIGTLGTLEDMGPAYSPLPPCLHSLHHTILSCSSPF